MAWDPFVDPADVPMEEPKLVTVEPLVPLEPWED